MVEQKLEAYVSKPVVQAFCILGIVVATVITAARIYVRLTRQRQLREDDFALLFAVVIYYALCALYLADLPYMYSFLDFTSGKKPYTDQVAEDYRVMMTYNFFVTSFFWTVLWSVKINLLLLFRRLLKGLGQKKFWWAVMGLTVITYIGCVISMFTSCSSISRFTTLGACITPAEEKAQIASLYYSFAADVITEILIMIIPLRLLPKLQKSRNDKIRLGCLFSVGIITIVVSIIRVFLIQAKTGTKSPSPAWLSVWAVIECMAAIIAGSIPALSQLFRQQRADGYGSNARQYGEHYVAERNSRSIPKSVFGKLDQDISADTSSEEQLTVCSTPKESISGHIDLVKIRKMDSFGSLPHSLTTSERNTAPV